MTFKEVGLMLNNYYSILRIFKEYHLYEIFMKEYGEKDLKILHSIYGNSKENRKE